MNGKICSSQRKGMDDMQVLERHKIYHPFSLLSTVAFLMASLLLLKELVFLICLVYTIVLNCKSV